MLVNVRHADQAEMLNSGKRLVKDIAEDSGDVTVVLPDAKFANLVEDVIILAPNAAQSYWLPAVSVCISDIAEVFPMGERDSDTGVEFCGGIQIAPCVSRKFVLVNSWYADGCLVNCLDGCVVAG